VKQTFCESALATVSAPLQSGSVPMLTSGMADFESTERLLK
jgi:hypothetical protein